MRKTIKALMFQVLNIGNIFLSNIYYQFSKKNDLEILRQKILSKEIKRIYINRTDRIGDAIVTLPLLIELKKHLKDIEIIVLTSDYNDWVLKPFIKTQIIKSKQHNIRTISEILSSVINDLFEKQKSVPKSSDSLLIDIKGDKFQSRLFKYHYVIGFKTFLLNWKYHDFIYNDFYVNGSKKQITQKYVDMFNYLFCLNMFPNDAPSEFKQYLEAVADKNIKKLSKSKYIIVYVGNKPFRNLSVDKWMHLINSIEYDGTIYIVDDNNYGIVDNIIRLGKNTKILSGNYTLNDLSYFASKSDLMIGIDGGGFNYLNILSNSYQIQSTCHNNSWKQYKNKNTKLIKESYSIESIYKLYSELTQSKGFLDKKINIYKVIDDINNILNNLK